MLLVFVEHVCSKRDIDVRCTTNWSSVHLRVRPLILSPHIWTSVEPRHFKLHQ